MSRLVRTALLAVLAPLLIAAPALAQPPASGIGTYHCVPPEGIGFMGACAPQPKGVGLSPRATGGALGVDLSVWNGPVNFASLRAQGILFEYSKADQAGGTDALYLQHNAGARSAGLAHGAYDFIQPGVISPGVDMAHFAAVIHQGGLDATTLPPVLDVESFNGLPAGAVCSWLAQAVVDLRSDLGWSAVIVYTAPGLWPACASSGSLLWDADWGVGSPFVPIAWRSWALWQWYAPPIATGVLAGMDRDRASVALASIEWRPPAPKPAPKPNPVLLALVAQRDRLRVLEARHDCKHGGRYGACRVWLPAGDAVNARIATLEHR